MFIVLQSHQNNAKKVFQSDDIIPKKSLEKCLNAAIVQLKQKTMHMPNDEQGYLFTVSFKGEIVGYGIVKTPADANHFAEYQQAYPEYSFGLTPKETTCSAGGGLVYG